MDELVAYASCSCSLDAGRLRALSGAVNAAIRYHSRCSQSQNRNRTLYTENLCSTLVSTVSTVHWPSLSTVPTAPSLLLVARAQAAAAAAQLVEDGAHGRDGR